MEFGTLDKQEPDMGEIKNRWKRNRDAAGERKYNSITWLVGKHLQLKNSGEINLIMRKQA